MKMKRLVIVALCVLPVALLADGGIIHRGPVVMTFSPLSAPTTPSSGRVGIFLNASNQMSQIDSSGVTTPMVVPAGLILMKRSGSCPTGWTEQSDMAGRAPLGTIASNGDVGTTGGSDTITPAGSNSAPTVAWPAGVPTASGAAVSAHAGTAVADHSYTPQGTNGTSATTATGTIAWPAGVPTFTGSALATHAHELPWQIPSTTTIRQIAVGTFGTGTSRAATAVSAAGTANTTSAAVALSQAVSAGTPAGTVAWPAGVPTFSGSSSTVSAQTFTGTAATITHSVTQPSNHTVTQPTIAWPAGVPTATAPSFTGTQFDNRSAWVKVIYCMKD